MPESKSFQRFNSRFSALRQHGQVINISLNKMYNWLKEKRDNNETLCNILRVSSETYPQLDIPSSEYARLINYSKKENSEYCFIELHNLFSYYMRDILKEMYLVKPKSITQKSNKALAFSKLSEFSSIDELNDYMIDEIFRELENVRSTPKLVKRILGHTKIQVPQALSDNTIMYLSIRHLIVHNNSKVDQEFYEKYKNRLSITLNGKVPTNYQIFKSALQTIYDYIYTVDQELIRLMFIRAR